IREPIAERAPGVLDGPCQSPNDIEHPGATSGVAPGFGKALLGAGCPERLDAGAKPCTKKRTMCAQHERCRKSAAVCDTACSDDGYRTDFVDNGRDERQSGASPAMPAGLGTLRDDQVR